MTNYRHGQMINLIDEMNSPLLAVEPQRCVLVRHRNGECLRCAAVCTTGAISLGEEGIVVSPEKCMRLGLPHRLPYRRQPHRRGTVRRRRSRSCRE